MVNAMIKNLLLWKQSIVLRSLHKEIVYSHELNQLQIWNETVGNRAIFFTSVISIATQIFSSLRKFFDIAKSDLQFR